MKGSIVIAVRELVIEKFGRNKWEEVLKKSKVEKEPVIVPGSDVDEKLFSEILKQLPGVLNITHQQLLDAFAQYWVHVYSQKIYKSYYMFNKTAKDFIKQIDSIHTDMTKSLPGAKPPRFDYTWEKDNKLVMTYHSDRNMADLAVSLLVEVGKYYNENLVVKQQGMNSIAIEFPN